MNRRLLGKLKALIRVGSSAVLGVMFGSLITCSCEAKGCAALLPEISASHQSPKSIQISRLKGRVFLVTKIHLACANPSAESIHAEQQHITSHRRVFGGTKSENILLLSGQPQCLLDSLPLGCCGLGFRPLVSLGLALLGEAMLNKPADDGDNNPNAGKDSGDDCWIWCRGWHWYHWLVFFVMCFFSGCGLRAMWQLMTPNDQKLSHAAGDSRQPEIRSENCPA